MADRIDMHVQLAAVPLRDLGGRTAGESSAEIRLRVERARTAQTRRFAGHSRIRYNAHAPGRWLDMRTPIDGSARDLLASAAERCALSARGYHRVIRVARTIADLDGEEGVGWPHVAEALRYRPRGGESVEDASVRDADLVVGSALVANVRGE
jgi:magnesium chelatase family protein